MSSRVLILLALVTAAAVAGYFALRSPSTSKPAEPALLRSESPSPEAAAPVARAPLRDAPAPTRTPNVPQEMIRYPDGTYMPPLNGVKNPAVLQWPPEMPFSPIIGKQTAGGVEWYVHADGTQTTTQMMWRSDVNREVAITHVARPIPVLPVEPGEEPVKH